MQNILHKWARIQYKSGFKVARCVILDDLPIWGPFNQCTQWNRPRLASHCTGLGRRRCSSNSTTSSGKKHALSLKSPFKKYYKSQSWSNLFKNMVFLYVGQAEPMEVHCLLRRWPQDSTAVLGRSPCKPRGVVLALSMEPLVKLLSCARRSCRAPHRVQAKGIGIGIPIVYIYIYI